MIATVQTPAGYRRLRPTEVCQPGDLYLSGMFGSEASSRPEWLRIEERLGLAGPKGDLAKSFQAVIRRK